MEFKLVMDVYVNEVVFLTFEDTIELVIISQESLEKYTSLKVYEAELLIGTRIGLEFYQDGEKIINTIDRYCNIGVKTPIKKLTPEFELPYEKLGVRSNEPFLHFKKIIRIESFTKNNTAKNYLDTDLDTFSMPKWILEKESGFSEKDFHLLLNEFISIQWYKKGEIFKGTSVSSNESLIKNSTIKFSYKANKKNINENIATFCNQIFEFQYDDTYSEKDFRKLVLNFFDFGMAAFNNSSIREFHQVSNHILFKESVKLFNESDKLKKQIWMEYLILKNMHELIFYDNIYKRKFLQELCLVLEEKYNLNQFNYIFKYIDPLKSHICNTSNNSRDYLEEKIIRYYYISFIHQYPEIFSNLITQIDNDSWFYQDILKEYFSKKKISPSKIKQIDFYSIKPYEQIQFGRYAGELLSYKIMADPQYFIWLSLNSFYFTIDYFNLHRLLINKKTNNPSLLLLICLCKNEAVGNDFDATEEMLWESSEKMEISYIDPMYEPDDFNEYASNWKNLDGDKTDNFNGEFDLHYQKYEQSLISDIEAHLKQN